MNHPQVIKVVIRSPDGRYVSGDQDAWRLTDDRAQARVFDFVRDHIPEQLAVFQRSSGAGWSAMPIEPRDRYETCDGCGQPVMSFNIFFDGERFLCCECRQESSQ